MASVKVIGWRSAADVPHNSPACHVVTQLSALAADTLADVLACDRSMNTSSRLPVWKLLLSKASSVLDEALDLLANRVSETRGSSLSSCDLLNLAAAVFHCVCPPELGLHKPCGLHDFGSYTGSAAGFLHHKRLQRSCRGPAVVQPPPASIPTFCFHRLPVVPHKEGIEL